jgi:hypothetical protein
MHKYKQILAFVTFIIIILVVYLHFQKNVCPYININITDYVSDNNLMIVFFITVGIIYFIYTRSSQHEGFELIVGDPVNKRVNAIDLENFFQFVEYFQSEDLQTEEVPLQATCSREGDMIRVRNAINTLLLTLRYIIEVNDKDNFYHRWMVAKMGSNMDWDESHPRRRLNYDEMVRNNIGKQFTITPENEFDEYKPNANLNSKYQSPMPHSISVHNYYREQNFEVNLLTLQSILSLVQENNPDVFSAIVRPTEHPVFQEEFVAPLKMILNSMLTIVMTDTYKEYLTKQKFDPKYGSLIFNPLMIRGQFGTF